MSENNKQPNSFDLGLDVRGEAKSGFGEVSSAVSVDPNGVVHASSVALGQKDVPPPPKTTL